MSYKLNPLTGHETGAEIVGLDLTAPVDDATRKTLNADFAQYHVLVFRDQKMTAPDFAQAGEIFGPSCRSTTRTSARPAIPKYSRFATKKSARANTGSRANRFTPIIRTIRCPPKATDAARRSLPSYGGDTQFVNMHHAYDDLPEATSGASTGCARCTCGRANSARASCARSGKKRKACRRRPSIRSCACIRERPRSALSQSGAHGSRSGMPRR